MITVRCSECDRIVSNACVGRLPDGKLAFGWCRGCLEVAGGVSVELSKKVQLFSEEGRLVLPMGGTSWQSSVARSRQRVLAISMLSGIFALWGLTMICAGFLKNEEPTPFNPSGSRPASNLFILSGGVLMGTATGLFFGVWRIQRRMRRPRPEFQRAEWLHPGNLPAILGLIAIAIAVWVGNSRVSALSVLFAVPCFASSWYWIGRKRKTRPQKSSFNRRIIEV